MHPYQQLEPNAFWRSGVAELSPLAIRDVWKPKFPIVPKDAVSTAGSCFAQHIGRALMKNGFNWFDAEPAPSFLLPADKTRFNYGIFSFRTANIYTTALLRQWIEWALGVSRPPEEIWEEGGRYFDPFRPTIEPDGFASEEELRASRATTLNAIKLALKKSSVFVFTLGLTEAWINSRDGYVYAACPGTSHGTYDAQLHAFRNYNQSSILADLAAALDLARKFNPNLRFLLTVSPVPLTATASGKHVLVATTYSKSVLRSVAGEYTDGRDYADYFPSYELVTAPAFRGMFYEPNMRNVASQGVNFVMDVFFHCMQSAHPSVVAPAPAAEPQKSEPRLNSVMEGDVLCEEELLEQFNAA
jgi:hypothetical protein